MMNLKTINDTCLIQIRIGDKLKIKSDICEREGQLISVDLVPNGVDNPIIVAVFTIKFKNGDTYIATSDKFIPVNNHYYLERIYR